MTDRFKATQNYCDAIQARDLAAKEIRALKRAMNELVNKSPEWIAKSIELKSLEEKWKAADQQLNKDFKTLRDLGY